jgi:DNA-directed RNA polymerase subunit RPC12/RpoP
MTYLCARCNREITERAMRLGVVHGQTATVCRSELTCVRAAATSAVRTGGKR